MDRDAVSRRLEELRRHLGELERAGSPANLTTGLRALLDDVEALGVADEAAHTLGLEALDAVGVCVSYVDRDQRYVFANGTYGEWFGQDPSRIVGRTIRDVLGPEVYERIRPHVEAALSGRSVQYQNLFQPSDPGGSRVVNVSYVPRRDAAGDVVGFFVCGAEATTYAERSKALLANLPIQLYVTDREGVIEEIHPEPNGCEGVAVGKAWAELVQAQYRQAVERACRTAVDTGVATKLEVCLADGARWYSLRVGAIRVRGEVRGLAIAAMDITDRKSAEEARARSEEMLRDAQRLAHIGSFDERAPFAPPDVSWSEELFRIMGRDPAPGAPALAETTSMIHPEDRERVHAATAASSMGHPAIFDYRIVRPDGGTRHVRTHLEVERGPDGAVVRRLGTTQDITDQASAAQKLRHALDELRRTHGLLLQAQKLASIGTSLRTIPMGSSGSFWSDEMYRIFGLDPAREPPPPEEMRELIHPDDAARAESSLDALAAGEQRELDDRFRIALPDGSIRHVRFVTDIEVDGEGKPMWILGVAQDITAQVAAEERLTRALKELRERNKQLVQIQRIASIGTMILEYPLGAGGMHWSDEVYRIYGRDPARGPLSAQEMAEATHPDDIERTRSVYAAAAAGKQDTYEAEWRAIRQDGKIRHVNVVAELDVDADGKPARLLAVLRDMTEQRQLEQEVREAQKLEAVGTLTSGIAHDYNNMLMGILGCTDRALKKLEPSSPARTYLEQTRRAAKRGASLTRQLLTFSRRQEVKPTAVDVDELIDGTAKMMRTLLGESIELRVKLGAPTWRVVADPGQLEQVLMNLVVNARDAMPDGGILTVESAQASLEGDGTPCSDCVVVTVRDTGTGMDEQTLARIFEPFFTTKGVGKGTGLGLATVYGIVKRFEGDIQVDSTPGDGTTFTLRLPRTTEEVAEVRADAPPEIGRPGTETVLLVEDDPLVRLTVRGYLERWGYNVLEACDLSEASLVSARHAGPIELLVTDAMLPGATGRDVAREVASQRSDTAVIFMSAHDADALQEMKRIPPGAMVLRKPFEEAELLAEVRRVLGDEGVDFAAASARPESTKTVDPSPSESVMAAVSRGAPTLLLVEDEEVARTMVAEALAELDYDVIAAEDAARALEICRRERGGIDALVTDLQLPDMSGAKLSAEVRALVPGVPVIYVSGRASHEAAGLLEAPRTAFVEKPVELDALAAVIEELLTTG